MKQLKRIALIAAACACVAGSTVPVLESTVIVAEAHSGRTDGRGGHRDNKNKSGLGSYHYHCGGYPAHLHENGVCPYASVPVSSSEGVRHRENHPLQSQPQTARVKSLRL